MYSLMIRYATYVGFFLGIGLISGSIVHMPLEPVRYVIVLLIGTVLFLAASFITEVYLEKKNMPPLEIVRSLFFSLCLSVGIGMMSGGIQHFSDNMEYSSYLIPIGFAISLFSYALKNAVKLNAKNLALLVTVSLAVVTPLRLSLDYVANQAPVAVQTDGHGHSHSH